MDKNDFFPWTQIPATFPIDISGHQSLMNCSLDMNFYNTSSNWDYSLDQNDQFESALSSMVSSPGASVTPAAVNGGNRVQLIELIGKLGSISSPSEIDVSPHPYIVKNNYQSSNNSSYSTPASSPPKLNLISAADRIQIRGNFPALAPLATDPGFAERAARLSCFGSQSYNERFQSQRLVNVSNNYQVPGSHMDRTDHIQDSTLIENRTDSKEESSVSQKVQSNEGNGRKRKSVPRAKAKTISKVGVGSKDSDSKRTKIDEGEKGGKEEKKEDSKAPEPPKDYIHVRARRGQATDSHSLAERVRREKISERMKFLQDLVPGCDKVTGKAVMLDEIINYVQSLQRQVECLSMKLSTVNPMMDGSHMEALLSKEILQSRIAMYSMESTKSGSPTFPYAFQSQESPCVQNGATDSHFGNNDQLRQMSINEFSNSASQVSIWEDELHNVVQMGFAAGTMEPSQMKMEP